MHERKLPTLIVIAIFLIFSGNGRAQTPAAGPDSLALKSGEKLTGHLQDATDSNVVFASDGLGKITVDWAKVQELRTKGRFAVIRKNLRLIRNANVSGVPQGTVAFTGQTAITVTPQTGPAQTVAIADIAHVVDQQTFLNAVQHNPGLLHDWTGTASLGAALVEATQSSVSVSAAASVARTIPSETWLTPSNRTIADFTSAYGRLSQPATPVVKTSVFHADAERDEYFTKQFFALGTVAFDHSFSQGLDLQQIYGVGIGWTAVQNARRTLDLQGSITYERQAFSIASQNQNLVGSIFSEDYLEKLAAGITLAQRLSVNPAWNDAKAYSMNASVVLTMPLHKQFGLTTSIVDGFINDPPPGFQKNSFQFTTALSYTFATK